MYFANNDIRVVQIALVDYLIHEKPVQNTIIENLDNPLLYQYVLKAGSTFQGTVIADEPDKVLSTKVNRVFAKKGKGVELLKKDVMEDLLSIRIHQKTCSCGMVM